MNYLTKKRSFIVANDEIDFAARLKPSAILQYFQDLVEVHSRDLGITHYQMLEMGKNWVLSRMYVEVLDYPEVGSKIIAQTFPHRPGNVEVQRSFYLFGEDGGVFAKAISKWCVLDIKTKRITKCKEFLNFPDQSYCPDKATKFPPRVFDKDISNKQFVAEFTVNNADLDINLHMNNARYGDIILNTLSYDEVYSYEISHFDISFLSELKYGNKYKTYRKTEGSSLRIDAFMDNKPVFLAYIGLRPNKKQD